jgi:hypothetical protein
VALMSRTFLIHKIGEVYLAVETTGVGLTAEFVPSIQMLPSIQFLVWEDSKRFFSRIGATEKNLEAVKNAVDKTGNAQIMIQAA